MSGWRYLPFDEAVEDASGGNFKTKQNEYADAGSFAIVDQGKAMVAGYTDDSTAVCKAQLPVVIFGDHTRCLKYVDFPFGMGADGVKVLRPKVELDVKFLYHYLRQLKLPDGGYDRHFKYLKRESVPVPPLDEQRRIAAILDQAETLRTQRRAALAQLDSLTQSIFLDMFGDPVTNPKRWQTQPLTEFFQFRTGKLDSNAATVDGEYPFFTCSKEDFRIDRYAFDCEALLLAGNNASADYSVKHYIGKFNAYQRTYVLILSDQQNSYVYARVVLEMKLQELKRESKGSSTKYLTIGLMDRLRLQVPEQSLQQTFATRIQAIESLKATHRKALAELDALFASLQQRAFAGEL